MQYCVDIETMKSEQTVAIFLSLILLSHRRLPVFGLTKQSNEGLQSIFKEIGFSPSCISRALAQCENFATDSPTIKLEAYLKSLEKETIKNRPKNCADLFSLGDKQSGIKTVYPYSCCENRPVSVLCDQVTDGGGWTVFQHREALSERENFYRNWVEYRLGFGKLQGEFWLGLDNIHALVSNTLMELRVDLEDFDKKKRWAKYEYFYIGDLSEKYLLDIGSYSGNAGDSLTFQNGNKFSTKDQDNDQAPHECAKTYRGAWWYAACHGSNLNGYQYEGNHTTYADGIIWAAFKGAHYSLKISTLSLRPKFWSTKF